MVSKTKPKCGRPTVSGNPCKNPAGFKTNHVGEGACFKHGGNSRIKHGRYSQIKGHLADKIKRLEQDPNPADLLPELVLLRAMLERWLEKTECNIAGFESAGKIVDGIRKTVDTIHKMQTRELLTSREMEMGLMELSRIISEEVKDPDVIQRISSRFASAFKVRVEVAGAAIERIDSE